MYPIFSGPIQIITKAIATLKDEGGWKIHATRSFWYWYIRMLCDYSVLDICSHIYAYDFSWSHIFF